ncbi:MAG: zinc-ribbon domain-containing protein [Candidatus Heimdallarchaeaceae archaeon]
MRTGTLIGGLLLVIIPLLIFISTGSMQGKQVLCRHCNTRYTLKGSQLYKLKEDYQPSTQPAYQAPTQPISSQSTTMSGTICPNCGQEVSNDDVFCTGCGTKVK